MRSKIVAMASFSFLLTACGGGGGGSHQVQAIPSYSVSTSIGQNGNVSPTQASVSQNKNTAFTFTPDAHYHLKTVTGCAGTLTGNTYTTAAITGDCLVTAAFELDHYTVTAISSSANGTASLQYENPGYGQVAKVIAFANVDYAVDTFSGCGAGTVDGDLYTTGPVTADCAVTVTFKKVVPVQGTAAEGVALANAVVVAKCVDGTGFSTKVITDADGHFSGEVGESAFPCALSVTSGNPAKSYYSLVSQSGIANITPLTDIILSIASNQTGADWFASANWKDVIAKLDDAQKNFKDVMENKGYPFPTEPFLPFTTAFHIGDYWDHLLDELNTGRNYLSTHSYNEFATQVSLGHLANIPTPSGSFEETAEACFNPVLYAEGTSYTFRSKEQTTDKYTGYDFIFTYKNQKIRDENGVPTLNKDYSDSWTTDGFAPTYATGNAKQVIDFEKKIVKSLSFYYLVMDENKKPINDHNSTYETILEFNVAKGVEKSYMYESLDTGNTYIEGKPVPDMNFTQRHSIKRTFMGITTIQRLGSMHKVCQFDVKDKYSYNDSSDDQINDYTEYYLVGSGMNVSDSYLISAVLNGQQL